MLQLKGGRQSPIVSLLIAQIKLTTEKGRRKKRHEKLSWTFDQNVPETYSTSDFMFLNSQEFTGFDSVF